MVVDLRVQVPFMDHELIRLGVNASCCPAGPITIVQVAAPHPNPLPVKNGEREFQHPSPYP